MNRESCRYFVIGSIAFLIDFGITSLCLASLGLIPANSAGFLVANMFNFLSARRWVFAGRTRPKSLLMEYVSVLSISLMGLMINNGVVWLLVGILAAPLLLGKAIATVLVLYWNFILRRTWIYRENSQREQYEPKSQS